MYLCIYKSKKIKNQENIFYSVVFFLLTKLVLEKVKSWKNYYTNSVFFLAKSLVESGFS